MERGHFGKSLPGFHNVRNLGVQTFMEQRRPECEKNWNQTIMKPYDQQLGQEGGNNFNALGHNKFFYDERLDTAPSKVLKKLVSQPHGRSLAKGKERHINSA